MANPSRVGRVRHALAGFYGTSLIRNASFLMVSNVILSGFGFLFWIVAARLYPKVDIGVASVVLTSTAFATTVGLLGLDSGILRFLSQSKHPERQLQSTVALASAATLTVGLAYLFLAPHFSGHLAFLRHQPLDGLFILAYLLVLIANTLAQNTFIAERRSVFLIVSSSIFSVGKVVALFALTTFGALGIVGAGAGAGALSVLVSFVLLRRTFHLTLLPRWHRGALGHVRAYASTLFLTGIENSAVTAVVPLIVLSHLGAAKAADYYIALSIAQVLGTIPATTFQSLLAEGSHSLESLHLNVHRSAKHVFILLLPAVAITLVAARFVLLLFGGSYAHDAQTLLELLALAAPFSALNYLADAVTHVRQWNRTFFVMNSFNSGLILLLAFLFVGHGLVGLGFAWLLGQVLTVAVYAVLLRRDIARFIRPRAAH